MRGARAALKKSAPNHGVHSASIGPVTSATLREFGLPVDIEAKKFDIPGLVAAIVDAKSRIKADSSRAKARLEKRFPKVWVPSVEQRDTRQLLLHRHKLVCMRRQVKNEMQHLALNQGVQQKRKLWSVAGRQRLEELPLTAWTKQRREDLLQLLDELSGRIAKLDVAAQQEADRDAVAQLSQTHPGVGPNTALAFSLTLGEIDALRAAARWSAIWD